MIVLEYQPRQSANRLSLLTGAFFSIAAVLAATYIVYASLDMANQLLNWGSCGTGRRETAMTLLFEAPLSCVFPAGCWRVASGAGHFVWLARLGTFAAFSGWFATFFFFAITR